MIIKARNLRIAALAASLTLLLTAFGMSEAVRAADSSSPTLKLPVPRINTANRKKFRSYPAGGAAPSFGPLVITP
ncbi:MAG: hypothetical protein R3F53_03975 [Gammaproteobacteria bacterium]